MLRFVTMATIAAAGVAAPALADPAPRSADAYAVQSFTGQLAALANQTELRRMLAAQGYIVTSDLNRNDSGLWVGTATRDGKVVPIAIKMPARTPVVPLTN